MMTNNGIILLSGGLDSVVSLAKIRDEINIKLALLFDYGQKSFVKEYNSSKKVAEYYHIEHKVIKLPFLQEITNSALVSQKNIPDITIKQLNQKSKTMDAMNSVWVPNRNALFINIAASFCDSYKYDKIIIGANKEEAETFSDNSKNFIKSINELLKTSANYDIETLAPLIDLNKVEIVKLADELNVPLNLVNSCYNNTDRHCGRCESCNRLKRALLELQKQDIISELFEV